MATAKTTTKKTPASEFAVIKTGGKQYRVAVGEVIKIEKLKGGYKKGDKIS